MTCFQGEASFQTILQVTLGLWVCKVATQASSPLSLSGLGCGLFFGPQFIYKFVIFPKRAFSFSYLYKGVLLLLNLY